MQPTTQHTSTTTTDPWRVDPVETPNPDAMMFRVHETLVPTGTYEYTRAARAAAADSPLAQRLLALDGVELVLIAPRFVTVAKDSAVGWAQLLGPSQAAVRDFLASGEMAVFGSPDAAAVADRTALEARIIEIIDEEVRPAVASDGGEITFMGFRDGIVYVSLTGACGSCPSSTTTLKMGIERLLMEEIPEVKGVEHA